MDRMKTILVISVCLLVSLLAHRGYGQEPVMWTFRTTPVTGNETTLLVKATIAPGWHLYSQRMPKGGPIPTRFKFDSEGEYIPVGVTEERGPATVFYDHTYEMQVIWYTGSANFSQRFRLHDPDVTIEGEVEYMACNEHVCFPGAHVFSIDIRR